MADIKSILGDSLKSKVLGVTKTDKVVKENPSKYFQIIGKNLMSLHGFARDLNVARQNIQKLVKLEGGEPVSRRDAHFLKAAEREKKLEVEVGKEEEKKKPTPAKKESKLKKLTKQFTSSKILKSLGKYLVIGAIIGSIFFAIKDAIVEWITGLWETIKEKFDEFVESIKQWFKDVIQPIIDKVMEFSQKMIDTVSNFFQQISDWISEKFAIIGRFFEGPLNFVKSVIDKVMSKLNSLLDILPDWVKKKLGITKKVELSPEEVERENARIRRQEFESERAKVARLEKEKQYGGTDEIIRERLGLPPVAAKEMVPPSPAPAPKVAAPPTVTPEGKPKPAEITVKPTPKVEKKEVPEAKVEKITGMDDVKKMVIRHEGIRYEPYKDSLGLWTIGVGHLIGDGKSLPSEWNRKFSEKEVMDLFEQDFAHHVKIAEQTPGYNKANEGGKGAFIDLAFNMGKWWPKWPSTKKKLEEGDFQGAAQGLQDSKWYEQVKGRAKEIVALVSQAGGPQGSSLSSSSTDLASGQRQQAKASTPMVVNAPTTNNSTISKTQVAASKREDAGSLLTARATA